MPQGEQRSIRELGGSAGATLLSILGEYVVPSARGAWQETLVRAMADLGFSPVTVRQAISRSVRDGALITTRHGNRAYVEVEAEARRTLIRGTSHLDSSLSHSGQDVPDSPADSEWDVFVARFRDKDTNERYHLRTSLLLKGLGYLGNGVWISPPTPFRDDVVEALTAEPGTTVVALRSRIEHPDVIDVVRRAWDIDSAATRYQELLDHVAGLSPAGPVEHFVAWTQLIGAWRRCVQADPGLPARVLPQDWPRRRAVDVIAGCRQQWRAGAHEYFASIAARTVQPVPPGR